MTPARGRRLRRTRWALAFGAVLVFLAGDSPLFAQYLPDQPLVLGDNRLAVGGDVSFVESCAFSNQPGAKACTDDPGFFNYTDYYNSALRMARVDVDARLRANEHIALLGELRAENPNTLQAYALYARVRPWTHRNFDIQVGRVPPTFGAFARRTYAADNPLIGYPLAYQYLTSLRPDALPANADELLHMRGRGWQSSFSIGNPTPDHGMPLVDVFRWDTGVQAHAGMGLFEATGAVTMGTVGNPLVRDNNAGKQIAGRIEAHPTPGFILGISAAHGPFISTSAARSAGVSASSYNQTAWGADAEYSWSYYLIRAEAIVSDWTVPFITNEPLRAFSTFVEGRYKLNPRFYVAGRVDHLGFSTITGSTASNTWDAPVDRLELGAGFALQRNLELKSSVQHNARGGGRLTREDVVSVQLVYWF